MVEVKLHARAVADLEAIVRYLLEHSSPESAERVRGYVLARIAKLRTPVQLGMQTSHPSIRMLSPTKYPYRVYFTRTTAHVVILHIRHTAREHPNELATLLDDS